MAVEIYQQYLKHREWDIYHGGAAGVSWYSEQIVSIEMAWNCNKKASENRMRMAKLASEGLEEV